MYGDYTKTVSEYGKLKKCVNIYSDEICRLQVGFDILVERCEIRNVTMNKVKQNGEVVYKSCISVKESSVSGVGLYLTVSSLSNVSSSSYASVKKMCSDIEKLKIFGLLFKVVLIKTYISCDTICVDLWLFSERTSEVISSLMIYSDNRLALCWGD